MSTLQTYYYRILTAEGKLRAGFYEMAASHRDSARLRLERELDATVLSLHLLPAPVTLLYRFVRGLFSRNIKAEDRAAMLRDMGVMLRAGVPLLDALKTIDGERRETGSHAVAHVARQLHEDLDSGLSVSEAVKRRPDVFPETVRNLIVIGDRSGRLDHMLIEAAEHTERMINIGRDIRTALIYPAFVFATLFAVMAFWLVYVVPKLGELFERLNADMPAMTQGLVTFGQLTADYFLHGVAGLAAIVFMTVWVFRRYEPARFGLHTTLHYLPIMRRITLSAGMARLTEHMAILVQSGVDLISTLDVLTQTTTDLYYRRRLQRVSHSVSRGEGVAASMRRVGGFPPMVVRMIGVGESSGSVDEQLRHLAQEYRRRLDVIIGSLGEIIKPLVVLVAGGLFFFMVVALLLPIYNLIGKTMQTSMGA